MLSFSDERNLKPEKVHTPWSVRNWVQLGVLAITLAIGLQFYIHVNQVANSATVSVTRPAGVEGFLPIGALMGWKQFFSNGSWDKMHPAGMVILGFAGLISFLGRKSFCSWFCPLGTLSELLWKLGRRTIGCNFRLPRWFDFLLRSCKYALLGFFVWVIMNMSAAAIAQFLASPYYRMADVKMLQFFTRMSATTALIIIFLMAMSFLIQNFWCRYFCPYGALMGLLALLSPLKIHRRASTCIQCGRCTAVCPHQIAVNQKQKVRSPECSGCMDCILSCPAQETLLMESSIPAPRVWQPTTIGTTIILLFVGAVYLAQITGNWQSRRTTREFRMGLMRMEAPTLHSPMRNAIKTPENKNN